MCFIPHFTGELRTFVNLQCSHLKAEGVKLGHSEEIHTEDTVSSQLDSASLIQLCSRIQLWPAMEYLAVLWQYKLTADCVTKACLRR